MIRVDWVGGPHDGERSSLFEHSLEIAAPWRHLFQPPKDLPYGRTCHCHGAFYRAERDGRGWLLIHEDSGASVDAIEGVLAHQGEGKDPHAH